MGCMSALPYIVTIPYASAIEDFAPYAPLKGSFLLDSSLFSQKQGRFSFWGYNPKALFQSQEGLVTVQDHTTIQSPHLALKEFYQKVVHLPHDPYFPFCGGLVGFLSYEWGAAIENIAGASNDSDLSLPDSWFGLYDTVVGYDHLEKVSWVASMGLDENLECDVDLAKERAEKLASHLESMRRIPEVRSYDRTIIRWNNEDNLRSSATKKHYLDSIQKILDYLRAGDCYQVNLTQRFMAAAPFSPWEQYLKLREVSPAPYSCFLNGGSFQILSSSPESLLQANADGTLITRPIKGTRPRGQTPKEDQKLREELIQSTKDQAELLMITDLERNDLGKVCVPGSIEVPELRTIETFAQVHHLLSTIRGKRKEELDIIDCLTALMPGGSITGAPKIRSMEIIHELETVSRGIYTGAIGFLGPANTASFNIAIRTMILKEATAYFSTGGGIVIDSDPETEYEETLTKAKGMMEALGLGRTMDQGPGTIDHG